MHRALMGLLFGMLASGCFLSRGNDDGGADTGEDGRDPACEYLGAHPRCGDAASCPVCPRDWGTCSTNTICLRGFEPMGRPLGCRVPLQGEDAMTGQYCFNGARCLNSQDMEGLEQTVRGGCVDDEVCRELHLEPGNERFLCRYYDGTFFEDGPPELAECPDIAPGSPGEHAFCGAACGDCLPVNNFFGFDGNDVGCIGIDEDHAFGVCVMLGAGTASACGTQPLSDYEMLDLIALPRRATCMRALREDGTPYEKGWLAFEGACESYVRMFPGRFECARPTE